MEKYVKIKQEEYQMVECNCWIYVSIYNSTILKLNKILAEKVNFLFKKNYNIQKRKNIYMTSLSTKSKIFNLTTQCPTRSFQSTLFQNPRGWYTEGRKGRKDNKSGLLYRSVTTGRVKILQKFRYKKLQQINFFNFV